MKVTRKQVHEGSVVPCLSGRDPPRYRIEQPATGRVYCQCATTGAPVGLAVLAPGLRVAALRLPIARATVRLLASRHRIVGLEVHRIDTAEALRQGKAKEIPDLSVPLHERKRGA